MVRLDVILIERRFIVHGKLVPSRAPQFSVCAHSGVCALLGGAAMAARSLAFGAGGVSAKFSNMEASR
jgi:hypothetical protein